MILLNYHEITAGAPAGLWTLPEGVFDAHLALCAGRLIGPADFLARCDDPAERRTPSVLLTFDDAFLSDYDIVYGRHMADGTVPGFMSFVPVSHVGGEGRMTWPMIGEMARAGVVIGSHGLDHVDLTAVSDSDLGREVERSKAILEDRLGLPVPGFAFPYGKFTRRVWNAALGAGYTHLFTIQHGHHQGFEPFLYSRLCVTHAMDAGYMRRHLADPDFARGGAYRVASRLGLYRALMRWRFR